MLKELIVSLFLLLITTVFLLSGREIRLQNKKTYLLTEASLKKISKIDFKLSLDSNRVRVRRKKEFFQILSGSSYYPDELTLHTGKFCPNPSFNETAYDNFIVFSPDVWAFNLQSIFSDDPSVSDWFDFNGILGLNPFKNCKNESFSLDPLAPLNQIRGNFSAFALDTGKLTFTNEFPQGFQLPLNDGMFFEMEQVSFGDFNFGGVAMKGKIDLESRYIKVPSRYFDEIQREFKFLTEYNAIYYDNMKPYRTKEQLIDIQIAIQQPSQGKSLKFPLKKYWQTITLKDKQNARPIYMVKLAFERHNESYWSFGLHFLEDFRVRWDLKEKKIGFEPINSN